MNNKEVIEAFLEYKRASQPKTTIKSHQYLLSHFFSRVKVSFKEVQLSQIVSYISEDRRSANTLYTRYIRLRLFYRWVKEEGFLLIDPFLKVPRPRVKRTLPKNVMTKKEAEKMLDVYPSDLKKPISYRNRLMLELLYSCSLRRSELLKLKLSDYDSEIPALKIRQSKTKRSKMLPVGKVAFEMLETYLKDIRPQSKYQEVFLTYQRKPFSGNGLTSMVKKAREVSGIRTRATSYSFRKTSATQMLRGGAKIEEVQRLLGHARAKSTEYYTKIYPKDLIRMHRTRHPREKQKNQKMPELKIPRMLTARIRFNP